MSAGREPQIITGAYVGCSRCCIDWYAEGAPPFCPNCAQPWDSLSADEPRCRECGVRIDTFNPQCPTCMKELDEINGNDPVLGYCPHGVNLDREFCPDGCRV